MGTCQELPEDFRCPISLEIMTDPVILPSGHTFDRSSIQRWLDSGNRTCPISNLPLPPHPSLIPNLSLRSLISNFTPPSSLNPTPTPTPTSLPSLLSTISSSLSSSLTSSSSSSSSSSPPSSTSSTKNSYLLDALRRLHSLLKHNPPARRAASDLGAVSTLLNCLSDAPSDPVREAALAVVFDLSLDDDNKVGLVAEGAVPVLVSSLRCPPPSSQALAATTLTSLAVVQVNKATIGSHPQSIPSLVSLLRSRPRAQREAATALFALCSFPDNQRRAVDSSAVPALLSLASSSGLERAVEVLSLLAKCPQGKDQLLKTKGLIQVLLRVLSDGRPRGVQHALSLLNLACASSHNLALEALQSGALEVSLGLVGDDNLKIRRNAATLIRTLRGCRRRSSD